MDAVNVVLIYTLMQTPVFTNTTAFLYGGAEAKNCTEVSSLSTAFTPKTYIACQRRRRRFWIRPGRTAVWWENSEKEVVLLDKWHKNFRMSRSSLLSLSELLHSSIEGRNYAGSCKQKLF